MQNAKSFFFFFCVCENAIDFFLLNSLSVLELKGNGQHTGRQFFQNCLCLPSE